MAEAEDELLHLWSSIEKAKYAQAAARDKILSRRRAELSEEGRGGGAGLSLSPEQQQQQQRGGGGGGLRGAGGGGWGEVCRRV